LFAAQARVLPMYKHLEFGIRGGGLFNVDEVQPYCISLPFPTRDYSTVACCWIRF